MRADGLGPGASSGARSEWEAAAVEALAALWRCRLELVLLAVLVAAQRVLARPLGDAARGRWSWSWAVLGVLASPMLRRPLLRALYVSGLRRAWERAAVDAGCRDGPLRSPRVRGGGSGCRR